MAMVFITEMQLPNRPTVLIESAEPRFMQLRTETSAETLVTCRSDIDEPNSAKLKIEIDDPHRV
jgi:hypothetical protein